ncbi:unnamed protein product [Orchesella dallaii]|uniref:Uncharacterized protein n=1 Tax=Orchesella dallaii TaxID=48710 RepID=A0ABP1PPN2_9HEXA
MGSIKKQQRVKEVGFLRIIMLITIASMVVIIFPSSVSSQSIAPDNLVSTVQIIVKLCYVPGVSSEKVAWQFFGCYDHAPGKQLFVKCQKRTFNGVLFNSVRSIKQNCGQPLQIPKYASCLRREFMKAGLDMNVAVRKLNACQLPLLQ